MKVPFLNQGSEDVEKHNSAITTLNSIPNALLILKYTNKHRIASSNFLSVSNLNQAKPNKISGYFEIEASLHPNIISSFKSKQYSRHGIFIMQVERNFFRQNKILKSSKVFCIDIYLICRVSSMMVLEPINRMFLIKLLYSIS